jgi:hypothetical protein
MAPNTLNDTSKEVTTSKDAAVIQPGKPDLGFHPGVATILAKLSRDHVHNFLVELDVFNNLP